MFSFHPVSERWFDAMTTFETFHLGEELQAAIRELGLVKPSSIQELAIPLLLEGRDIIGQAQTGTGKTAAFAIPVIARVQPETRNPQALVLCPTRELALQVAEAFQKLAKYKHNLLIVPVYGGQPIATQAKRLQQRPQIIIGTPGRVMDLMRRCLLDLERIKTFVLDEADEMLNMGFREDIEMILGQIPASRQTVFFSATMPATILELAATYQNNARHVKVAQYNQPVPQIEQLYIEVQRKRKRAALMHLLESNQFQLSLVFCNTKLQVDLLVQNLKEKGYSADGLHGGMPQTKRDKVIQRFRKGKTRLLIATDVAARGLDIQNIEAVFNYDLPREAEFYIHRIGRTGRAGKTGRAYTFVDKSEFSQLKKIRHYPNVNLFRQELPQGF
jgi:ATP-dependent RNA helicase DeaD